MSDHTTREPGSGAEPPEVARLRALAATANRAVAEANPRMIAQGALARSTRLRRRRTVGALAMVSMAVIAVAVVAGGLGRLSATPPPPAREPSVAPSRISDPAELSRRRLPPLSAAQVEAQLRQLPVTHARSRMLQDWEDLGTYVGTVSSALSARLSSGRTVSLGGGTMLSAKTTGDRAYAAFVIGDGDWTDPNAELNTLARLVVVELATGRIYNRRWSPTGDFFFFWTSHTLVIGERDPGKHDDEHALLWSFPDGQVRQGPPGRPIGAALTGGRFMTRVFGERSGDEASASPTATAGMPTEDPPVYYTVYDVQTLQAVATFWEPLTIAAEDESDPLFSDDGRMWVREDLATHSVQSSGPAPALPSWLRRKNVVRAMMASDGRFVFILVEGPSHETSSRAVGVVACDPAVPGGGSMSCSRVAVEKEWVGWMRLASGEQWCPPKEASCRPPWVRARR